MSIRKHLISGKAVLPDGSAICHVTACPRGRFFGSERSLLPRIALVLGAVGVLFLALPVLARPLHKPKTKPAETAIIENTGSTNTNGYRVTVTSAGIADCVVILRGGKTITGSEPGKAVPAQRLPAALVKTFFTDLKAAMPLSQLLVRHGMKSASFGTSSFVSFRGQRSPDLSFPGDPKAQAVAEDMKAIIKQVYFPSVPHISAR